MKIDLYYIIIPVLLYLLLCFYNENSIDKFDIDMKNFFLNNNDNEMLLRLSKEKFTLNKVTMLLNEFYKTNNPQYIAFAIRMFLLKVLLFFAIAIGISIAIIAFLFKYLV